MSKDEDERKRRLAAALRQNLKRGKAQERAAAAAEAERLENLVKLARTKQILSPATRGGR